MAKWKSEDEDGFSKLWLDGYGSTGVLVPSSRERELKASWAKRQIELDFCEHDEKSETNPRASLKDSKEPQESGNPKKTGAEDQVAEVAEVKSPEPDGLQVPVFFQDDLDAKAKSLEQSGKFSERDRTNAVKGMLKTLRSKPLTRKVGMPADVYSALNMLDDLCPHVTELKSILKTPLLIANSTGKPPLIPPILLVGPPGLGKSHIATQLSKVLSVPSRTISYSAGGSAGNVLSGGDKSWGNASTGMVFNELAEGEFANPVFCLDEIDKAGISHSTSGSERHPLNELLALLEQATSRLHQDKCSEFKMDASHIVWIATANSVSTISAPVLSRFQIVLVRKPDARAAVLIAKSIVSNVNAQLGVSFRPPTGEVLQFLATLTPRTMRRIWIGAVGNAFLNQRTTVSMFDIEQSVGAQADPNRVLH